MKRELSRQEKRLLLQVQIALVVIAIALGLVKWRVYYWPIVTWPMYSHDTPDVPQETFSLVELRLIDEQNDKIYANMFDLLHFDRARSVGIKMSEIAFSEEESEEKGLTRAYLIHLIQSNYPDRKIKKIEGWRREWTVSPMENPPFRQEHPDRLVFLDSISVE